RETGAKYRGTDPAPRRAGGATLPARGRRARLRIGIYRRLSRRAQIESVGRRTAPTLARPPARTTEIPEPTDACEVPHLLLPPPRRPRAPAVQHRLACRGRHGSARRASTRACAGLQSAVPRPLHRRSRARKSV